MLKDLFDFVVVGVRDYFIYFGGAFVLLWLVAYRFIQHRKVQLKRRANAQQWIHEVKWSLIAQVGFVVGLLIFGDGKSPGFGIARWARSLLTMRTARLRSATAPRPVT